MKRPPAAPPPRGRLDWLFEPVDIASLAVFRILFGVVMWFNVVDYLWGARFQDFYVTPVVHFSFPGLGWLKPLPEAGLKAVFWLLAAAALGIAAGFLYRLSAAVFLLGSAYVLALDKAFYNNHNYLICLLAGILAVVPAHRALSLDARLRPALRSGVVPAWCLYLLRFQVALPYVFGGLAKLNYDWLVRAQPLKTWFADGREGFFRSPLLQRADMAYSLSWGGAAFDLLIVPLLLWRRTRAWAAAAAIAFHLANAGLFMIEVFPWLMIPATFLFLSPSWPRSALGVLRRLPARADRPAPPRWRRLTLGLLGLYVAIQLVLPLRHFAYPGAVDWTEEGHTFAWRMKLRDKRGKIEFVAVDAATKRAVVINGAQEGLTFMQWRMMTHDPDMIRQYARFLAERLRATGHGRMEVRALTSISLNGRPAQPMVNPRAPLSDERRRWGPEPWIEPLEN